MPTEAAARVAEVAAASVVFQVAAAEDVPAAFSALSVATAWDDSLLASLAMGYPVGEAFQPFVPSSRYASIKRYRLFGTFSYPTAA